jgi:hypothetical protein
MKRWLSLPLVGALLAWASMLPAQVVNGPCNLPPVQMVAFAFETLSVGYSPVKSFTTATFAPPGLRAADIAVISVEPGFSIRYRTDGTAPTLTVGHHSAAVLTPISVCGASNVGRFQAVLPNASNDGPAVVNVTFYRVQ